VASLWKIQHVWWHWGTPCTSFLEKTRHSTGATRAFCVLKKYFLKLQSNHGSGPVVKKKVCFQKICRHVSGNDSKWKILTHASGSGGVCLSRNTSVGATKKSSFFYMCSGNYVYHNDIIFKLQLWKKWPCSSVSLGKIVLKSNNQAMAVDLSSSR